MILIFPFKFKRKIKIFQKLHTFKRNIINLIVINFL
jgi:hypothetical protein